MYSMTPATLVKYIQYYIVFQAVLLSLINTLCSIVDEISFKLSLATFSTINFFMLLKWGRKGNTFVSHLFAQEESEVDGIFLKLAPRIKQ